MRFSFILAVSLTAVVAQGALAQTPPPGAASIDLVRRWWQWRAALPELALPNRDTAGHFCDIGQSGDIWFLAGFLNVGWTATPQAMRRACAVPAGRRIFFPVVTILRIVYGETTCSKAQAVVSGEIDHVAKPHASLDGTDLPISVHARTGSGRDCFPLKLQADGPSSKLVAAADGYWLSIEPLSVGRHTLTYGSDVPQGASGKAPISTTYDLDVK